VKLDLGSIVASAFRTIAASIDGAVRSVAYTAISGPQTYNPTTDKVTASTTVYSAVEAIFVDLKRTAKDSDFQGNRRQTVEVGDVQCLIAYPNLPITVSLEDTILDGTKRWRIVDYSLDPTGKALHTFHLRQG
jgi:hypothetical protein